jgi:hypothetical protein
MPVMRGMASAREMHFLQDILMLIEICSDLLHFPVQSALRETLH